MTQTPKPPKSSKPSSQDSKQEVSAQPELDAAEKDAIAVQRWYPLSFLLKLLLTVLCLFVVVCLTFYIMAGTEGGSKFLVDKLAGETGVTLKYGEGNLRDGLSVTDIVLKPSEDMDIYVNSASVKIGWRAIFVKQVHLRDATIDQLKIIDHQPPSGKPFDYRTLDLPVNLRLDSAKINRISYEQATKEPVIVTDVSAQDLSWIGTTVHVAQGNLQYADIVNIAGLSGEIDLQGDYPLDAKAVLTVNSLEKIYVSPLNVMATGTLKRTVGKVRSRYNDSDVYGEFSVQGLDDNAPFEAKLMWDDVTLPYAESQNIRLQQGLLTASGVLSDIDLRINSELSAENIPSGHYQGRAKVVDSQMLIDRLVAVTANGQLLAKGVLDWEKAFTAKAMVTSDGYRLNDILPEEVIAYAPEKLAGQLAVVFNNANADGDMQINADLRQKDGEHIHAKIIETDVSDNPRHEPLWRISAQWNHLIRKNVPDIGTINSPNGSAIVDMRGSRLNVNAKAQVVELNAAPKGDYDVRVNKIGNRIVIPSLLYNGVVGNLAGHGEIRLAENNHPLRWKIDAKTTGLLPKEYDADLPVSNLVGNIVASGEMQDIQKSVVKQYGNTRRRQLQKGQRHRVNILSSDLKAVLDSTVNTQNQEEPEYRYVTVNGTGAGEFELLAGNLSHFDTQFDGNLQTQGLPDGTLAIDVNGTAEQIHIKNFKHEGSAGHLLASGDVDLRQGIGWDINATAQNLNIGAFAPQTQGIVSGDLVSQGHWKNDGSQFGNLSAFDVSFNGSLDTPDLPKGQLVIDAGGTAQTIHIRQFSHIGDAGSIVATGDVDVSQGVRWDITTNMNDFNVGYFVTDMPSAISGKIATTGSWQDDVQKIHISDMNVQGQLKGQPLVATGGLDATLHLPKDMQSYLAKLQKGDAENQVSQVKAIAPELNVRDLAIRWADNEIVANGTAQQLQAQVNINSLHQLSEQLAGQLQGGLTWIQTEDSALPTIYVDLTGARMALSNFILTQGQVKGKIVNLGKSPSQLALSAKGLQLADRKFEQLNVVFDGTEQQHSLTLALTDPQATVKALIKGGLNRQDMQWKGVIGQGEISSKYATLQQKQPAEMLVDIDAQSLQLAAHCWEATNQSGKLCLRKNLLVSKDRGQVDVAIQKLNTSLFSPFLPSDIDWKAQINGKALLSWQQGRQPDINATLYTDNGRIGLIQDGDSDPVSIPYERVSLIAKTTEKGLNLRTDINTGQGARGYADVLVDPYQPNKPISGALVLNELNLAIFKPFFPGMRVLEGNATMAGGLGGTLTKPVFYGDVNLQNGRIAMLDLPVNLSNINAKAKVRGQTAVIEGSFNSGDTGKGTLSGTVDWQQELQAKLSIAGEHLIIAQPPLLYAEINPDLDIIIRPNQRYVNIEGAVLIPEATIRPPEASNDVVTKSEDVVVLDRRLIGNINEVLAVSKPWSINADIGIDLGKDVSFRGFGATLPLAGAINVTQKGQGVMQALGVIQVSRRSKIDAFGQNLDLNYGQIRFNGDVRDPALSIEAIKEIEGQTVGLRVTGNVSKPNITVFNNAGLTQEQAMNALVTGRLTNTSGTQISEEGFKSEVTNNLAAAGLSFGLSGTRSLTNSIGKAFGLESLTLDASGSGNDTSVNVTGYITPDLYIRYGVGVFNAQSSLSLRYQLTRRVYIEATTAAEKTVDVIYSWQF
ncbi:translocation/assembly module TamB domain-containing protein [Psychrobacter sp. I-STPA6b]|uniref:translocation/assembly module TamB domain-containing protein n=1 Tax=Psychrobacter sp. I-STPA6b TaxID=2585718 RepID=UPI001D0C22EB|nr:translocation/assembly module TamB domain-containing protein [Psychrobacter sp. I-STPA6b]